MAATERSWARNRAGTAAEPAERRWAMYPSHGAGENGSPRTLRSWWRVVRVGVKGMARDEGPLSAGRKDVSSGKRCGEGAFSGKRKYGQGCWAMGWCTKSIDAQGKCDELNNSNRQNEEGKTDEIQIARVPAERKQFLR